MLHYQEQINSLVYRPQLFHLIHSSKSHGFNYAKHFQQHSPWSATECLETITLIK